MNDRRQRLLDATCRVIASDGIRGLRVENVAAEAGVSTSLIYYYFTDRAGLLAQAMQHVNSRAETYADAEAGETGREQFTLQMLGEFQDDDAVRENSAVWGELRGAAVFDEGLRPVVSAATERWIADLAELIERGRRDGSVDRAVDPAAVAIRLSALVEGLSNRWLARLMTTGEVRAYLAHAMDRELACR
ncbi:regulatory protein, tetR family [Amycolatopsis xylanica]|uniref:Regulatory protein, tetR family n=1 Tax=Amycolatopsis xylanica TaxID=589385 RepID=A0A1H3CVF5_9PSEU|nr:TetR family transcriptional regulator C-terminal domain-containing protein [Amycolatopsis xylanica]SDX57888.1 regulatory protein, tetR family [Amycolatopsis xylanica]